MDAISSDETCTRDAISWLPDEVLGKILSFLSTKQAVSTSVLSKTWRYVSRLVLNNLDFDDSVLVHDKEERNEFPERFKNFVNQTLALQSDFPIKKFSLNLSVDMDNKCLKACVGRWISKVVERGVLELELRIKNRQLRRLPPQLFASKTLVKLTLWSCPDNLPSYVSFPSLKSLFIDEICFKQRDFCSVLLDGCPVLEEFSSSVITRLTWNYDYIVSSPSVKRLSAQYVLDNIYNCPGTSMSLDLPNCVYLNYSDNALCAYPQVNLESLIEAKLDIHLQIFYPDVTNLVMGIRNVEILHLSPFSVDVIYWCKRKGLILPLFNNLVNLSFGSLNEKSWGLLADLLEHSPKLENLTIEDLNDCTGEISMPLNQVKVLHVLNYCGTAKELKHFKFFLGEFECIELVQVDFIEEMDDGIILQATKDLEMLPEVSVSSKCHVKVVHKHV